MLNILKKALCFTLTIAMSISFQQCVFADIDTLQAQSSAVNIIYADDMEQDSAQTGSMKGTTSYEKLDDEHGRSLVIDSQSATRHVEFYFDGINENVAMEIISFEMQTTYTGVASYVNQYMKDIRCCTWRHRNDGKTTFAMNYAGQDDKLRLDTPVNEWTRYDVALDYSGRMTYYYVNGELIAKNPLNDQINGLERLVYTLQKENGKGAIHYIDNLYVVQVLKYGTELTLPFEVSYPSFVDEHFNINTNRLGSVYFGDELDFELEFINNCGIQFNMFFGQ